MEKEYVMSSGLHSLDLVGLYPFKSLYHKHLVAFVYISFTLICYSLNLAGVILKYEGIKSLADSIDAVPAGQQVYKRHYLQWKLLNVQIQKNPEVWVNAVACPNSKNPLYFNVEFHFMEKKHSFEVTHDDTYVMVKLLSVLFLKKKMRHLYNSVDKKWPNNIYGEELETKLIDLSKKFKKLYNMYRTTIWFTCVLYVSKPLILFSRTLLTEMYIPCNLLDNRCYLPFVGIQTIYIIDLAFVVYSFDGVFYSFLFHAYCELEKIKYGFANLKITTTTEADEADVYTEFCKIVRHHNSIIKFLVDVNGVYYLQLLNHFVTITATIVFGIFFMNMDGFPPSLGQISRYIPYLMSYHFQLYIYCMWGQEVFNQVYSVGDIIYESKWYVKHQPKLTKGMLLVMNVSRISNKLTIGDLWKLNLATFMSVIKTSMSFHAFMQTVYKGDEALTRTSNGTLV